MEKDAVGTSWSVPALHERNDGKGLVRLGFSRIWQTMVGINGHLYAPDDGFVFNFLGHTW